jgi:hypothetical protein
MAITRKKPRSNQVSLDVDLLEGSKFYKNTAQEFISTTADKITIMLMEFKEAIKAQQDSRTPLATGITIASVLVTSNFKSIFGIDPMIIKGLFIAGLVASIIWFLYAIVRSQKTDEKADMKKIIEALKQNEPANTAHLSEKPEERK